MNTKKIYEMMEKLGFEQDLRRLRTEYIPLSEMKLSPNFKWMPYQGLSEEKADRCL